MSITPHVSDVGTDPASKCEQTTFDPATVPSWALEACTGIAEYESKSKACEAVGCYEWHRWCGPCMAAERRDHLDDITEVRSIGAVS